MSGIDEKPPGLLRQRRNLVSSSLVLLILKFGHLVGDEIPGFGYKIKLAAPGVLPAFIWLGFGWFLFRYVSYLYRYAPTEVKKTMDDRIASRVMRKIRQVLNDRYGVDKWRANGDFNYWAILKEGWIVKGDFLSPVFIDSKANYVAFEYVVPWVTRNVARTVGLLISALVDIEVSDYLMPLALAGATIFSAFL